MKRWAWFVVLPWAVVISSDPKGVYSEIVYKDMHGMLNAKCAAFMDCAWQQDFVDAMNEARERRTKSVDLIGDATGYWERVEPYRPPRSFNPCQDHACEAAPLTPVAE